MTVVELRNVTKRFDQVTAVDGVSFTVDKGRITSLLGPSGCGKTTTLRLIAGFETPDEGTVWVAGQDMRGRRPYERNVGLLFQDYALFPHMTVEQNVAYGLRHRGFDRRAIPRRTGEMLELVKLEAYRARRPSQLSGGEQQRVALARALATNPEVMLLDEPLSALDAKLRQELRIELKEILLAVGSTTIVVTHDQEEAMSLADEVIVIDRGRIMQRGSPVEIYARPTNKFVAEFVGRSNWFAGRLGGEESAGVCVFETTDGVILWVPSPPARAGGYEVCLRPERIDAVDGVAGAGPERRRLNTLRATVIDTAPLGSDVHTIVRLDSGKRVSVIAKNLGQPLRTPGQVVTLQFRPEDCIVVPANR